MHQSSGFGASTQNSQLRNDSRTSASLLGGGLGSEPRDSFYNAFDNTAYAVPPQNRVPSPPPGALRGASPSAAYNEPVGPQHERGQSSGDFMAGHSASGSYEPLMASYWRQQDREADDEPQAGATSLAVPGASTPPRLNVPSPGTPPPPIPARNPRRMTETGTPGEDEPADDASRYSTDSTDDRLNPARRASQDLRDEADYSRPVLAVRNASILSTSKEEGE
ncbi:hypothetical protein GGG16DRAFT_56328 [Schizophyllum commune]|nr:hypothetical protein K525DRAFT_222450 [Schizophyllum commune Loenen D]